MKHLRTPAVFALVWAVNAATSVAAIPFPDALAAADVRITGIKPGSAKDNLASGLVVGNGAMNAIVYVAGKDLMLRVSKNDVWDGRIDTSEDPELPKVDPATHALHREKPGNPPSWNKPYPCGVPCADIKLGGLDGESGWAMELRLAKAAASVTTCAETTTVRALAQGNVFFIHSRRRLELVGVPQKFLPEATQGTADGVAWLCQRIPGDEDTKGMEVYLAAGARGDCQAVAVVTTTDAAEPLKKAVELVREILERPEEEVVRAHEAVWTEFWSRSGVRLGERRFQDWWYRMVYYFRCFSKKGATAVGLKTSFDGLAGWHNSYKFNYNIQQTFLSAGPINHPELVEPIIDVLANYWPRARWFARNCFVGCEGAFVHSDVFHPHEPDPAVCKSRNRRQFAYIPWGYTLGMQGHIAFLLWEYYQYKPDAAYLKEKTYPMIRDIALFYCSFVEKCQKDDQGKYLIGPSYFPENFYFGQDNVAYDLPYISYALKAAREAAGILKTDESLVNRIDAVLAAMPYYETVPDPNQDDRPIVTYYRGVKEFPKDDRHASMIQAVFPAGQVTWFSPQEERELFKRTINHVGKITTHANSPVTLNVARARLGMTDEAWRNIAIDFTEHHKEKPNGLFAWKAHGNYMSEQVGVARMITELVLQSVDDTIRLFPAWPAGKDAEFANLRAQGGFLVSARMAAGQIGDVSIRSTAGGNIRLLNPWPGSAVRVVVQATGVEVRCLRNGAIVAFPTQPEERYLVTAAIVPAGATAAERSLVPNAPSTVPDYFCTWNVQGFTCSYSGADAQADAMIEANLFGAGPNQNWLGFYRKARADLTFLLDDACDLPIGGGHNHPVRGSVELDAGRFPSYRGTPVERLTKLSKDVRARGWRDLGLWICNSRPNVDRLPIDSETYWCERLAWSQQAGVRNWKVDWGIGLPDKPLWKFKVTPKARAAAPDVWIEFGTQGDLYRTYDVAVPVSIPETIRRIAAFLAKEDPKDRRMINCEDEVYIGAGTGSCYGVMRHPLVGNMPNGKPDRFFVADFRNLKRRIDEVTRAVRWHRIAHPVSKGDAFAVDEAVLTDYKSKPAPARIARGGLPLPKVTFREGGEPPYVLCCRHADGEIAVATIPRNIDDNGRRKLVFPLADVTVDAGKLDRPVGVFGEYASLTLTTTAALNGKRILAQDLAGDSPVDITAEVKLSDGKLTIPGAVIRRVGLLAASPGDVSDPGLVLAVEGLTQFVPKQPMKPGKLLAAASANPNSAKGAR